MWTENTTFTIDQSIIVYCYNLQLQLQLNTSPHGFGNEGPWWDEHFVSRHAIIVAYRSSAANTSGGSLANRLSLFAGLPLLYRWLTDYRTKIVDYDSLFTMLNIIHNNLPNKLTRLILTY